jgi:hypothetical protein
MARVTKTSDENTDLIALSGLVTFLNIDFDAVHSDDLNALKESSFLDYILVKDALKDAKQAKDVQREMKEDLVPILAPNGDISVAEAYQRIEKLLKKLNEVAVKAEWHLEPVDYEWEDISNDEAQSEWELVAKPSGAERQQPEFLNSIRTINIELLGHRWFLGRQIQEIGINFSRENLYLTIQDALETGIFSRLKLCPQCNNFFIADDSRQRFCSEEHRNAFNNKERLKGGYFLDLRRKKRIRDLKLARRLKREGKSPGEIAKATKLSLRILNREGIVR